MQNILLHQKPKNKRSVQSIIQDSIIDHEGNIIFTKQQNLNHEVVQLKKAYNQTYKTLNLKIRHLQQELQKARLKNKKLQQANVRLASNNMAIDSQQLINSQKYKKLQSINDKLRRKLQYVQNKYKQVLDNQSQAQKGYLQNQQMGYDRWIAVNHLTNPQLTNTILKDERSEIYKEFGDLIAGKVKQFTKQIKLMHMNRETELKLQAFLEELVYITPVAGVGVRVPVSKDERQIGKISRKNTENLNTVVTISDQEAWKELQKSLQNLKKHQPSKPNPQTNTPGKRQPLQYQQIQSNKQTTPSRRQHLFNRQHSKSQKTLSPLRRTPINIQYKMHEQSQSDQNYINDRSNSPYDQHRVHFVPKTKPKIFTVNDD